MERVDRLAHRLISEAGAGNTDACVAAWTAKCGVGVIEGGRRSDYPIANQSGDILFYSPELLDGPANGLEGAENVYLYRNGAGAVRRPARGEPDPTL